MVTIQIDAGFTSTLAICGSILKTVTSDTLAIVYKSETGTLEIYSDDASLGGTTQEVVIAAYLTAYPQTNAKVSFFVEFAAPEAFVVSSNLPPEFKKPRETSL